MKYIDFKQRAGAIWSILRGKGTSYNIVIGHRNDSLILKGGHHYGTLTVTANNLTVHESMFHRNDAGIKLQFPKVPYFPEGTPVRISKDEFGIVKRIE